MTSTVPDSAPSQVMQSLRSTLPSELIASNCPRSLKKKASSDPIQEPGSRKKKRVQFVDPDAIPDPPLRIMTPITQITLPDFDLCQTKSICHYLRRTLGTVDHNTPTKCLGYLDTPCHKYKHKFFFRDKDLTSPKVQALSDQTNVYTIFDIMQHEADDVLEAEDQLRLALKAALATLQYNDTPWLAERWRLNNMSFFNNAQTLDPTALKTLHLSSQISWPDQAHHNTQTMDGIQNTADTVSDEIKYGINNLPLFFLGVALLEIAHWKPLEEKMIPRDQQDQVYTARRLAQGRAPLGPEYQKIAQKCLQCNFGFGTKLSSKSLQTAVYNDVVCELEGMLERLAV